MKLNKFEVKFKDDWDKHFSIFNKETRNKIKKKIIQMEQPLQARGLKQNKFLVEEVGQYRIAFYQNKNVKEIPFVGNHKQYEKWYKKQ
ncbi:MAG: hypothetical protein PHP82_02845 [Candidatus ainarchaeum sp.]|nr:hypothetical protein [Candidatus ainarchaeum sp.]